LNTQRFNASLDGAIGVALVLAIMSAGFGWQEVHVASGFLFGAGVLTHIALHRRWLGAAFSTSSATMPAAIRRNRVPVILLIAAFSVCCCAGLGWFVFTDAGTTNLDLARTLARIHDIGGIVLICLVTGHAASHAKWIADRLRRSPRPSASPAAQAARRT
jgi:hypothetical protein